MGRYINCEVNGESNEVYKYALGDQPSEMDRISTELRIGEYHLIKYVYNQDEDDEEYDETPTIEYIDEQSEDVDGDILILMRSDIEKLNTQLEILEANLKINNSDRDDEYYIDMIVAIRDFMNAYPQEDKFTFIGEF